MSDSRLLPCPGCGCHEVVHERLYLTDIPVLSCGDGCGFAVFHDEDSTWDELHERWNRRAAVTDYDFAMAVHDGELWGKCSECKERQGYYLDAETIQRQQERIAELERERDEWQLKCCEEAGLHASHVFQRDELIRDLWVGIVREHPQGGFPDMGLIEKRMRELGIEV